MDIMHIYYFIKKYNNYILTNFNHILTNFNHILTNFRFIN